MAPALAPARRANAIPAATVVNASAMLAKRSQASSETGNPPNAASAASRTPSQRAIAHE